MDYSRDANIKRHKKRKSNKKRAGNKIKILIFRVFVAVFLVSAFAAFGAGVGIYLGIIKNAPALQTMTFTPEKYATIIYYADTNEEIVRLSEDENREYVKLDKVPEVMRKAQIAIEDERFYSHNGIDFRGMGRAIYVTLTSKKTQGASTLTQQVIKNNVMGINRNSYETKLQEQYLAVEYEKELTMKLGSKKAAKDQILETYLNTIGLGHGLNGVQSASKYYFAKDVSELSLSEAAVIASITQSPTALSPVNHPEANKKRQHMVLGKMLELKMVTQEEYDEAIADNVYDRISQNETVTNKADLVYSYYTDAVIENVIQDLMEQKGLSDNDATTLLYNGGLKIYVPQDKSMQQIMDNAFLDDSLFSTVDFRIQVQYFITVKNNITDKIENRQKIGYVKSGEEVSDFLINAKAELLKENETMTAENNILVPQPQAAMVIVDSFNGEVKAITGGRGEKVVNRSFDRATDAKRQPGSVFKILSSYAPAIDMGVITPATPIDDTPLTIGEKEFSNWNKKYKGLTTVREGIWDSMNILAIKNLLNIGIDNSFDYLHNFGITTLEESDRVPALALGGLTEGVTQLELAGAFATIANGGLYHKPSFYTKVLDHSNSILLENNAQPRRVIKETSAFLLTDMMRDVVERGTGTWAKFRNINMPVSGKTGTTTDTKDLTFSGFTPYYTASIWLGNDDSSVMKDSNQHYHLTIWRTIMEQIHENLPVKSFTIPDGIVQEQVCRDSGELPSSLCSQDPRGSRVITEYFAADNVPTDFCNVHQSATVNATPAIPSIEGAFIAPTEIFKTIVGIVKPNRYSGPEHIDDSWVEINRQGVSPTEDTFDGYVAPNDENSENINDPFIVIPSISEEPTIINSDGFQVITPAPTNGNNLPAQTSSPNLPTATPNASFPVISEEPYIVPDFEENTATPTQQQNNENANSANNTFPQIDAPNSIDNY